VVNCDGGWRPLASLDTAPALLPRKRPGRELPEVEPVMSMMTLLALGVMTLAKSTHRSMPTGVGVDWVGGGGS
jgi:hypothetical protein